GWDAQEAARAASPTYQKYSAKTDGGGTVSATGTEADRKITVTEADRKIAASQAQYEKQAKAKFGPDILDLNGQWGGLSDAEKIAFKRDYADEYARLKGFWAWRETFEKSNPEWTANRKAQYGGTTKAAGGKKTTAKATGSSNYRRYVPLYPPRTYSYGGGGGGRSYGGGGGGGGGIPIPPTMPPSRMEPLAFDTWTPQQFAEIAEQERKDDPVFDTLVGVMFGSDTLGLANQYYSMDATQRADWIAKNPQAWARLLRFLLWLMKQMGTKTDYTGMLKSIPPNAPNAPTPPPASVPANAPALR
ncbi:MAG: hypothetical protein MUC42_05205, partial [Bryobacter sp.]|nr:hypothetical protein [Bryobacter sp.]